MDSPERRKRIRSRSTSRSPRKSHSPRRSRSPRRSPSIRTKRSRSRSPRRSRSPKRRTRSPSPSPSSTRDRSRTPEKDSKKHKKDKNDKKHKKDKHKKDKHKKDKHKEKKEKKEKEKKEKKEKRKKEKATEESVVEEAVYVEKEIVPEVPKEEDYVLGPLPFHMVRRPENPIEITEEIAMRAADKGLVKHVVREGEENVYPAAGQRVTVKYTGKFINGKIFDSSEKFSFVLGRDQVIRGWDVGVAQMELGEKAQLIVGSQYGYGRRGSPPKIPPNCILVFDVELLSIF